MSQLTAENLGKSYQSRRVVDDVSMTIDSGQVVGLLGPNGAGKTTCFYMVVGLVPCGQGRIEIDDIDLTGQPMHIRALHGLGYLPQEPSVFRKLSVAENILAVLEIRKDLDKHTRLVALESLMQELHIHHLAKQTGASLWAGSAAASRLHVHWLPTRVSSCSTSRLPVSTRFLSSTSSILLSTCGNAASAS